MCETVKIWCSCHPRFRITHYLNYYEDVGNFVYKNSLVHFKGKVVDQKNKPESESILYQINNCQCNACRCYCSFFSFYFSEKTLSYVIKNADFITNGYKNH